MRRLLSFAFFVVLVAVLLVLATGSSPLSTEVAKSEEPSGNEAMASPSASSSNSSSSSIKITMTGMVGDPGNLMGK